MAAVEVTDVVTMAAKVHNTWLLAGFLMFQPGCEHSLCLCVFVKH